MTTAFLPAVALHPLEVHYNPEGHQWRARSDFALFGWTKLGTSSVITRNRFSPAASLDTQSISLPPNNENDRTGSADQFQRSEPASEPSSDNRRFRAIEKNVSQRYTQESAAGSAPIPKPQNERDVSSCFPTRHRKISASNRSQRHQCNSVAPAKTRLVYRPAKSAAEKPTSIPALVVNDLCVPEPCPALRASSETLITETSGAQPSHSVRHAPNIADDRTLTEDGVDRRRQHHRRLSNASSGCVRTIKTASISNLSLSIAPQSLKIERSSESRGRLNDLSRHSMDSQRPMTSFVIDEAASRRGLKRKEIINELILTEESYITDLKALSYLYATLMSSPTTVQSQLRRSMHQNVACLLHMHEVLLANLSRAIFKTAAHKWADTERLNNRCKPSRREVRGLKNPLLRASMEQEIHYSRNSIDTGEVDKACAGVVDTAEPADILDLIDILDRFCRQSLHAYEEYCATYKSITHELQRHTPFLGSTYESGIEALNKSIVALNNRATQDRKGMTVGDLLIKPVQRICRYPLLLEDLIRHMPVVDSPIAHGALEDVISRFTETVRVVNLAIDNHAVRAQVQRKWKLQDRLTLNEKSLSQEQFQTLGFVQLIGVLYLIYQDNESRIEGTHAVCVLFDDHLLVALPTEKPLVLEPAFVIPLPDLKLASTVGSEGLQCHSSLPTWKISFTAKSDLHEILLSACSEEEEEQWKRGLQGKFRRPHLTSISAPSDQSRMFRAIKSHERFMPPSRLLTTQSLMGAHGTVAPESDMCKVLWYSTDDHQDLQADRNVKTRTDVIVQPIPSTHRVLVLSPKRTERARLENSIHNIYTKDRLPFPGGNISKGGHLIRASAGSLVRKLSFASMQASFSRRSASLSSRKSAHTIPTVQRRPPTFSIRQRSCHDHTLSRRNCPKELPELDTMDSLIERMIGSENSRKRLSFSKGDKLVRKNTTCSSWPQHKSASRIIPDDPATIFCQDSNQSVDIEPVKRDLVRTPTSGGGVKETSGLGTETKTKTKQKKKKKRWSNPMTKLRDMGEDRLRHIWTATR